MKPKTVALACILISLFLAVLFVSFNFPVFVKCLSIILAAISGFWAVVIGLCFASFMAAICFYCEDEFGKDSEGFQMNIYREEEYDRL